MTDAGGLSTSRTFAIEVADVNEAPGGIALDAGAVAEDAAAGTVVGTAAATDPDAGDTRSFAITGGNTGNAFTINPSTGAITVANSAALDFDETPRFTLSVRVTDVGGISDTATVTIDLLGDSNQPPVANDTTFVLAENAAVGAQVGTAEATDPDAGDTPSFAITTPSYPLTSASGPWEPNPVIDA